MHIILIFYLSYPTVINFELVQVEEVDVDARDVRGVKTPLFLAVKAGHEPAVRLLIGRHPTHMMILHHGT